MGRASARESSTTVLVDLDRHKNFYKYLVYSTSFFPKKKSFVFVAITNLNPYLNRNEMCSKKIKQAHSYYYYTGYIV
jgi:hypothetical protein